MDIDSDEKLSYMIKFHGWKNNYFSQQIIKRNMSLRQYSIMLGVSPQNMSNWVRTDEEKMSDSVKALIRVMRQNENKELV